MEDSYKESYEDSSKEFLEQPSLISPPVLESKPGSYAVHGIGSLEAQVESIPTSHDDTSTSADVNIIPDAELVDPNEREAELQRAREETRDNVIKSATLAEVVDETAERKRRQKWFFLAFLITCCSVVVAIVVAVTFATKSDTIVITPTRSEAIQDAIVSDFGGDSLDDELSPQYAAASWMAVNDTYLNWPLEDEEARKVFRQRYSMCVLAFATDIDNWVRQKRWLDPVDECTWSGLTCDSDGQLVGISVRKYFSVAFLPTLVEEKSLIKINIL